MGAISLLLPAIGGYWLLSRSNYTRYRSARLNGYQLLFLSASVGMLSYGFIYLLLLPVRECAPDIYGRWVDLFPLDIPPGIQVTLFLSATVPHIWNQLYPAERGAARAAQNSGDLVELTIHRALVEHRLIEVSLRSRKVYVGVPVAIAPGSTPEADVSLVPHYSGYRDCGTLEFVPTRNYGPVVTAHIAPNNPYSSWHRGDFAVVFPISEVVSVRFIKMDAYVDFGVVLPTESNPPPETGQAQKVRRIERSYRRRPRTGRARAETLPR